MLRSHTEHRPLDALVSILRVLRDNIITAAMTMNTATATVAAFAAVATLLLCCGGAFCSTSPWDVPGGLGHHSNVTRAFPCVHRCADRRYAVHDHSELIEFLRCMSDCACDDQERICSHLPAFVCNRLRGSCQLDSARRVKHADPHTVHGAEDSRATPAMLRTLAQRADGFCRYCERLSSMVPGCTMCVAAKMKA